MLDGVVIVLSVNIKLNALYPKSILHVTLDVTFKVVRIASCKPLQLEHYTSYLKVAEHNKLV